MYKMEYCSAIKRNKITPSAAIWTELKMIISRSKSERQPLYDITYMWNLKYDTNEPVCETETGPGAS